MLEPHERVPMAEKRNSYDPVTGELMETWTGTAVEANAGTDILYGYDNQGRLKSVTQERLDGAAVGQLPAATETRYDAVGNPITTNQPTTVYSYDADGNLLSVANANGQTTIYQYDSQNRLMLETVKEGTVTIETFDYDQVLVATGSKNALLMMDLNGNRLGEVDTKYTATGSLFSKTQYQWTYDEDNRLAGETLTTLDDGTGGTSNADGHAPTPYTDVYGFDLDSNRISKTHTSGGTTQTTTSTFNADSELTQEVDSVNGTTTFTYDSNGNQTSSTNGSSVTTYTYDLRNRLSSVTIGGVTTIYGYDDAGNRVTETTSGVTTYYLIDANNPTGYPKPIEQKSSPTATPTISYILGTSVIGQATGGTVTYLLTDGHGSTRAVVSSAGNVTATFDYDAYGNAIGFNAASAATTYTIYLFGGDGVFDPISGLTFHGSGRQTDGTTGTFIERDPPTYGDNADPISLNKYLYANADPINGIDPSGNFGLFSDVLISTATDLALEADDALADSAAGTVAGELFSQIAIEEETSTALAEVTWDGASNSVVESALDEAEGAAQITFKTGHVAAHLAEIGLPAEVVESAIEAQVSAEIAGASATGSFFGQVEVEGQLVEYRAYTLPDGTINIGTYYLAP